MAKKVNLQRGGPPARPAPSPPTARAAPLPPPPAGTRRIALPRYRLTFPDGLLLSRGRPDSYESPEALLRADTLKSALLAAALPLYPALRERAASAKWMDSFRLTSGFPFCGEECFFPKPLTQLPKFRQADGAELPDEDAGKKTKKLRWLGQTYFEALLRGDKTRWPLARLLDGGALISDKIGAVAVSEALTSRVSALHQQPHVFVPRGGGLDAVPYHTESLHFGPDAGLWFAVDYLNPDVQPQVEAALRLLGDSGLGTDKNLGRGHFEWESTELRLTVPDAATATHCLNLGPWCPDLAANQLTADLLASASYTLSKRGGYLAAPAREELVRLRKKSVYMFDEGSVFTAPPGTPELAGALLDLAPADAAGFGIDHPVWRDGRPLWLPIIPIPADKTP